MAIETKNTNAMQKLAVSIINTSIVALASLPFYLIFEFTTAYKITLVLLFFFYNLIFVFTKDHRCIGMKILTIYWKEKYSTKKLLIYTLLYTLSFSTIVIWILFPFDLLIFNLIAIQLPCVLKTGTTLHGYLSGKISGYKAKSYTDQK
jgi:hypothetical protein